LYKLTSSVYTWFNNNCVYAHACTHTHICIERSSKTLLIMSKSSKKSIMSEKTEMLYMCEVIIWSSWFSVEFIWFISILMLPSWFHQSYLSRAHWYRIRALCAVRSEKQICITLTWLLLLLLLLLNVLYESQCWKMSIKENFTYKRL